VIEDALNKTAAAARSYARTCASLFQVRMAIGPATQPHTRERTIHSAASDHHSITFASRAIAACLVIAASRRAQCSAAASIWCAVTEFVLRVCPANAILISRIIIRL